ncbi:unnamed protein product [Didymodactylos carnosus]|uniref:HTH CENPB-type domain-containing protein n=1 Tax=Didymodactylos carnosus TaxID=1234261 RepID=A0A815NZ17_9BILA|nr:unnamed protein product [Didymodactylos carnosus]CAF4317649.1 unnamed protein product [Didymodactylos carnosus]
MINPHRVANLLSNLIAERLSLDDRNNTDSKRDEEVAKHLYDHVESILESSQYSFENEHTIDFNDDSNTEQLQDNEEDENDEEEDENDEEEEEEVEEDDEEDEQQQMNNDDEQFDEEFMEVDNDQHHHLQKEFSIPYVKQAIDFYDQINEKTGRKSHSWKAFQHRFPKVKNRSYIERFRKYLDSSGTKKQKLDQINQYTYNKFKKARSGFHFVRDVHLKRWALQKAREINDRTFEASDSWILHFKRRHALCSRKVTKLITQREVVDADTINDSANDFVNKIKKLLPHYRGRNVLNTDQTGLEIEMVGNRTLSFKGEKATFGKCYLCLKEKNGHMSDNIKKDLFQASNVTITCSKSGKLTSSLVEYWIHNVLKPAVDNEKVLLLLDAWGGQTDQKLYSTMKHLRLEIIPKKTTSTIQPLDITFSRQYKHIIRTIYDHVRLYGINCNLSQRNNIIKLTSLCYNQICSKTFLPMHRYSWFQGGYVEKDPGPYENVEQLYFRFREYGCHENQCTNIPLIQCSYCEKVLCFYHFFELYHIH